MKISHRLKNVKTETGDKREWGKGGKKKQRRTKR